MPMQMQLDIHANLDVDVDVDKAVNVDVDIVVKELTESHPNYKIIAVNKNSPVTRDFRFDRVRVFYDETTRLVSSVPKTG